jgi:LysM repeat protein
MKIGSNAGLAQDWESTPDPSVTQVRSGETLSEVASRLGVSPEDLQKANPQISDPNNLTPGSEIRIPTEDAASQSEPENTQGKATSSASFMERNL